MGIAAKLSEFFAGGVVKSIGDGIGSLLDRAGFTKKMSQLELFDKQIELIKVTSESDKLDAEDLRSAREMAMTQMRVQKASWVVRQLNGALRPVAGWTALLYLTEKMWSQLLVNYTAIEWVPIHRDVVIDFCMTGILAFFFGFRQRAKEKAVAGLQ